MLNPSTIAPLASQQGPARSEQADFAITERRDLGLLQLTVDLRRDADLRPLLETTLGGPLPAANRFTDGGVIRLWQSPTDWLAMSDKDAIEVLVKDLTGYLADRAAFATQVTDGYAVIDLTGEGARAVLSGGAGLDFSAQAHTPGRLAVTRLAQLRVTVVFLSEQPAWRLIVERSNADYLWCWLLR